MYIYKIIFTCIYIFENYLIIYNESTSFNWFENRKSIMYTNIVINFKSLYYPLSLLPVATAITPPRFAQIYESSINIEEITGELVLSFNEIPSARCRRHYQIIERCNSALSRYSLFFSFLFQSLSFLPYSPTRLRLHRFYDIIYLLITHSSSKMKEDCNDILLPYKEKIIFQ